MKRCNVAILKQLLKICSDTIISDIFINELFAKGWFKNEEVELLGMYPTAKGKIIVRNNLKTSNF